MPDSARALGQRGLRLRSRRVRSDRSHRLSAALVLALFVVAGLVGYLGGNVATRAELPLVNLPWTAQAP
jgi:hypothetical protein